MTETKISASCDELDDSHQMYWGHSRRQTVRKCGRVAVRHVPAALFPWAAAEGAHEAIWMRFPRVGNYGRRMAEHDARSEGLNVASRSRCSETGLQAHESLVGEPSHNEGDATQVTAPASDPELAIRRERVLAVGTVVAVGLLLLSAIGHLFLLGGGLVPFRTGEWGFPDYSYLLLMAVMSAALITHSTLSEGAQRPRAIVILSSTLGGVGTLVALAKGYLMMFGAAFADEDWVTYSVFGATIISILPFLLPLAVGIVLLGQRSGRASGNTPLLSAPERMRWRVRGVVIAIPLAVTVILLAALVPRWAGFSYEMTGP